MTERTTVVLLFGGRSSEHSISCVTAEGVREAIDPDRYTIIPVGVTRQGAFVHAEGADALSVGPDGLPEVVDNGTRVRWPSAAGDRGLSLEAPDGTVHSLGEVDVVFPILHGRYGEDGTVQGLFELLGLPYVGDGVLASAVAMDKHVTKSVLAHAGLPVAPWHTVTAHEWRRGAQDISVSEPDFPVFVKPARAGSSIGVGRVSDANALAPAVEEALRHDETVLIEQEMAGREIEIAVLGGRPGERTRVSVAGEIVVSEREFYDFEAKYLGAPGVDLLCPAPLTDAELRDAQDLAVRAFEAISGCGLARVDFFLTEAGFIVNEVNTMPGFTPISMFPKCWEASGLSYPELIDELITCGLAHGAR